MIAALSLTACATVPSRPSVVCPPVAAYDRAFQERLAVEIERLPHGAALEQAMPGWCPAACSGAGLPVGQ